MVKTIIQDKQMLFLALFAAFFVGSAITGGFSDYEVEAKKDNNNGNNGCENANPNAKTCEKNPNTEPEEASIDPTEALYGDFFTITDPEGRMQAGDVAVFESTIFLLEYVAVGNTISPDGTTLTGTMPTIVGGGYLVSVESSGGAERFSGISFTSNNCIPPDC